jgi:hypothetical protein
VLGLGARLRACGASSLTCARPPTHRHDTRGLIQQGPQRVARGTTVVCSCVTCGPCSKVNCRGEQDWVTVLAAVPGGSGRKRRGGGRHCVSDGCYPPRCRREPKPGCRGSTYTSTTPSTSSDFTTICRALQQLHPLKESCCTLAQPACTSSTTTPCVSDRCMPTVLSNC